MKFFNANTAHNILNFAIVIVSVLALPTTWAGIVPPETAAQIVIALGSLKLVMNALRDGLAGMIKEQPPVKK